MDSTVTQLAVKFWQTQAECYTLLEALELRAEYSIYKAQAVLVTFKAAIPQLNDRTQLSYADHLPGKTYKTLTLPEPETPDKTLYLLYIYDPLKDMLMFTERVI